MTIQPTKHLFLNGVHYSYAVPSEKSLTGYLLEEIISNVVQVNKKELDDPNGTSEDLCGRYFKHSALMLGKTLQHVHENFATYPYKDLVSMLQLNSYIRGSYGNKVTSDLSELLAKASLTFETMKRKMEELQGSVPRYFKDPQEGSILFNSSLYVNLSSLTYDFFRDLYFTLNIVYTSIKAEEKAKNKEAILEEFINQLKKAKIELSLDQVQAFAKKEFENNKFLTEGCGNPDCINPNCRGVVYYDNFNLEEVIENVICFQIELYNLFLDLFIKNPLINEEELLAQIVERGTHLMCSFLSLT